MMVLKPADNQLWGRRVVLSNIQHTSLNEAHCSLNIGGLAYNRSITWQWSPHVLEVSHAI